MSLVCAECRTLNPDSGVFCTGCGVSLAFATAAGTAPAMSPPRNAFPEEPGRADGRAGGSGALPWVLVIALAGMGAVAGTGWWAFQRTSTPDTSVPSTRVDAATPAWATDIVAPEESASAIDTTVVAEPPPEPPSTPMPVPPTARPPATTTPASRPAPPPRARPSVRQVAEDEGDAPAPGRNARPVGPVGGGPASACYGRTGYMLESCISAQCRQPYYRNHPGCRSP